MRHSMEIATPYYSTFLQARLRRSSLENPNFSLRAFARRLRVDAGALSSILNGRRPMTMRFAERVLNSLNATANERAEVLNSVAVTQKSRNLKRQDPRVKLFDVSRVNQQTVKPLDANLYYLISEWYYAAILELTYSKNFKSDVVWISKVLGIKIQEAQTAITRLLSFGLLEEKNGRWSKKDQVLALSDPYATSAARQQKQKQIRQKAIASIENDPAETRYMTSLTVCTDPALLPEVRKRIDAFNRELNAFLESGERKEVYTLELGIFSLEQKGARS